MDDSHARLMAEGVSQLAANGVSLGLSTLSLAEAARSAGLTIDDAERLLRHPGRTAEEQFREAVARHVLEVPPFPGAGGDASESPALERSLVEISRILERMPEIDQLTPAERGSWVREIMRASTDANIEVAQTTLLWHTYLAIAAAALSPGATSDLAASWSAADGAPATRYVNAYAILAERFGLQLRYCYTWEQFATAVAMIGEGYLLRMNTRDEFRLVDRRTGPDDEVQSWTLLAVCLEALVKQFFEPDETGVVTDLAHEALPADE